VTMAFLLLWLLPAPAALPQSLHGPRLGYVWDHRVAQVRAILGIPGSSLLGPAAGPALGVARIEFAPGQDYALAAAGDSAVLLMLGGERDSVELRPLGMPADRIAISPTGAAAALYSEQRGWLRILTGLPASVSTEAEIDFSGLASPAALAIADSGRLALAAVAGTLYLLSAESPPRPVATGDFRGLAFFENSAHGLAADFARNEVLLIRDDGVTLVAGERDGIRGPIGVAAAGRRIVVANAGSVAVLDFDGGPAAVLPCPCTVTGLHPLGQRGVFRLGDLSAAPLYLLDAAAEEARVVFVPAGDTAPRPRVPRLRSTP